MRCLCYSIPCTGDDSTLVFAMDIVDLEPAMMYFVRLATLHSDGSSSAVLSRLGPEVVFDTKPINCAPKTKSCLIS